MNKAVARTDHSASSSAENTLSRLSSRSRWATGSKRVLNPPDTFWVGESDVTSSGNRSSSP